MGTLLHDLRFALRMLTRARGLSIAAVLSLGLGIGANTTIFAWLHATVLDPLHGVPESGRVAVVSGRNAAGESKPLSYPDYVDLRDRAGSFEGLFAQDLIAVNVRAEGEPRAERMYGSIVTGNYFQVLGIRAAMGRALTPSDDRTPGAHPVVVLSDTAWRHRFNADPAIVGRTLILNGRAFTVVGVTPAGFNGTFLGLGMRLWVPMMMQNAVLPGDSRLTARGDRWLQSLGRLRRGTTIEQASAETASIARQLEIAYKTSNEGRTAVVLPLWRSPWGSPFFMRPVLSVLTVLVGLVLAIACANVANLLLGRAVARRREIAVRLALGAGRTRLIRQLLTESVLLALLAGAAGVVLARWSAGLLNAFVPPLDIPIELGLEIDSMALVYALAISVATGVAFGLAPALQASRPELVSALKDSAGVAGGTGRGFLRSALVVAQIAMCVVLLAAAALFLRSLERAYRIDPGFRNKQLVMATLDLFPNGYTPESGVTFMRQLVERANASPGIASAALVRRVPLAPQGGSTTRVRVPGYTPGPTEAMDVEYTVISPGYFKTMGIDLLRGRDFTWSEAASDRRLVIVNDTMARRYWGTLDVVGKSLTAGDPLEIAGVVATGKYGRLNEEPRPYVYYPMQQVYRADMTLVAHITGPPDDAVSRLRGVVRQLDPNLPLFDVKTLDGHLQFASFAQRIASTLLGLFGALALLLAVIGLYAVIAFAVGQRTREIGVRVALGARPTDVARAVLAQGATLTAIGVAAGLALALVVARFAASLLNGVSPSDPATFATVALGLGALALVATALPAWRASRIDPVIALRHE